MRLLLPLLALLTATALTSRAAIGIAPATFDKQKFSNTVTFTVTADASAATTTATLDGVPVAVGSPVTVTAVSYHELKAESRTAGNVLVDAQTRRFIVHDSTRAGSEDGIPPHTPFMSVPDAPSAFIGKTLKVSAPAAWPVGMPVPVAVLLRDGADENVRLNGVVKFGGFPQTTAIQHLVDGHHVNGAARTGLDHAQRRRPGGCRGHGRGRAGALQQAAQLIDGSAQRGGGLGLRALA